MKKVYVIGGANVDIYAKSTKSIIAYDSNPGDVSFTFGGVGRNIAENIANIKGDVSFISCFGNDAYGKELANDLKNKNINIKYSRFFNDINTSVYIAVLDNKDMYVGVSDMKILNNLSADYLDSIKNIIDEKDMVVLDSNLEETTINYIANNIKGFKVADAISCGKVLKLKNCLDKLDIFKLNKLEAEKLNGKKLKNEKDIFSFTKKLNKKGTKEVLVSSKNKLYVGTKGRLYCYEHNGFIEKPVNVTGAGDALISGYAYSRFKKKDILESASVGIAMAILTVSDIKPVTKLNVNKINKVINNIRIEMREIK